MKELVARTGAHPTHEGADIVHNGMLEDLKLYAEAYKALTIPWCARNTGAWWGETGEPQEQPAEEAVGPPAR